MLRANSSPSLPILPKKTVMDPKYHTLKDIPLKFFYWCFYSRLSAELSSDGKFLNHLSLYPQRQISAFNRWSIQQTVQTPLQKRILKRSKLIYDIDDHIFWPILGRTLQTSQSTTRQVFPSSTPVKNLLLSWLGVKNFFQLQVLGKLVLQKVTPPFWNTSMSLLSKMPPNEGPREASVWMALSPWLTWSSLSLRLIESRNVLFCLSRQVLSPHFRGVNPPISLPCSVFITVKVSAWLSHASWNQEILN